MPIVTRGIPVAVSLAVVGAVTAVLWYLKLTTAGLPNPVFFYLLPLALVGIYYGSIPALIGVAAAFACADYFLYEPVYSFVIDTRTELGDLSCFAVVGVIGVKCAAALMRPSLKVPAARLPLVKR